MSGPLATALRDQVAGMHPGATSKVVTKLDEFLVQTNRPDTIAFVGHQELAALTASGITGTTPACPVVLITDGPLQGTIPAIAKHSWLCHVMSFSMLRQPMASELLANVAAAAKEPKGPRLLDWIGPEVAGRRVRLTNTNVRAERLERMSEFFESKGVGPRALVPLRDVAEELLTNAFYDAPVAAGVIRKAIPRTHEVELPDEHACDLVYGCRDDLALVRVRDPFGALTRTRLIEVLTRCARSDMQVQVDESMGGAGLGLWRVFAVASFVAISVCSHRWTEFLVGVAKRHVAPPRPFAFHLFFTDRGKRRFWQRDDDTDVGLNKSIAVVIK